MAAMPTTSATFSAAALDSPVRIVMECGMRGRIEVQTGETIQFSGSSSVDHDTAAAQAVETILLARFRCRDDNCDTGCNLVPVTVRDAAGNVIDMTDPNNGSYTKTTTPMPDGSTLYGVHFTATAGYKIASGCTDCFGE